ncbi:MAG: FAD-binding protein [Planctomycetales bacterium]|nr:FAD-binding protein [Planctomycetales bacterium]
MIFPENLQHLIREGEVLAPFTWLQLGGTARFFAEPTSAEEFCGLVSAASKADLPIRILGDGSNLLIRSSGFDGLVIHPCSAALSRIEFRGSSLVAGAGAKLNHVITAAIGSGLAGLEHLAGIPGTIGGALVGNASVTNDDIGNRVTRVVIIDQQGQLEERRAEDLQFAFCRSNLDGSIVLEVELQLEPSDPIQLTRRMQAGWIVKRKSQPFSGTRNALAFAEPDGCSLVDLFELAGVKGAVEGEAALSTQFPGYIVVSGTATPEQVLALVGRVKQSVEVRSGIQLQSPLKVW